MFFAKKDISKLFAALVFSLLLTLPAVPLYAEDVSRDVTETPQSSETKSPDALLSSDITVSLPKIFVLTIDHIFKDNYQRAEELKAASGKLIEEGQTERAIVQMGAAAGAAAGNTPSGWLGNYCRTVLQSAGNLDSQVKFLGSFVKGYAKVGVTVISREAVEKFTAYGSRRRGHPLRVVPEEKAPAGKLERLYVSANAIFIPIAKTDILKIDLYGKEGGNAKIWKILPAGTNSKSWPGAKWEREVTVRGDRLY